MATETDNYLVLSSRKGVACFRASNNRHGTQPLDQGGFGAIVRATMPDSIEAISDLAAEYLASDYRDYLNNYLTVAKFAEHREITERTALAIIEAGKIEHEKGDV